MILPAVTHHHRVPIQTRRRHRLQPIHRTITDNSLMLLSDVTHDTHPTRTHVPTSRIGEAPTRRQGPLTNTRVRHPHHTLYAPTTHMRKREP